MSNMAALTWERENINDIKSLIELASTVEDANSYIEEFTSHRLTKDKLKFIGEAFTAHVIARDESCSDGQLSEEVLLDDYRALLNAIINKKWR